MAYPRLVRPGATYAICRRVQGRYHLLRPDEDFNRLFRWLLATVAEARHITLHVAVCMSNHFHLVVTAGDEGVSDFMHDLDMHLAKALQRLRGLGPGAVFEPGRLSVVELKTEEAVVEQIAYAIVNPAAAALVHDADRWPGVTARVSELGTGSLRGEKPDYYFVAPTWPEVSETPYVLPAFLAELGLERAHARLAAEVERQQAEALARIRTERLPVMGATAVRRVSPRSSPKTPPRSGGRVPHVAVGRGQRQARIAALRELKHFRLDHREAKQRWRQGDRDVVFPAGTYWMVVHHRARAAPFPAPFP